MYKFEKLCLNNPELCIFNALYKTEVGRCSGAGANLENTDATSRGASKKFEHWDIPVPSGLLGYYFENKAYTGFLVLLVIEYLTIIYLLQIVIITLFKIEIYLEVSRLNISGIKNYI